MRTRPNSEQDCTSNCQKGNKRKRAQEASRRNKSIESTKCDSQLQEKVEDSKKVYNCLPRLSVLLQRDGGGSGGDSNGDGGGGGGGGGGSGSGGDDDGEGRGWSPF
ncbi:hypothetical protein HZH66_005512 [Vespula vulgaris]|uniref:Uncharacterized protein n=1 Tax=Vespula vulgaris TaxID=7454 RepID=A0A834K4X8_VESVU|nr:hypothetical protein HZH66_005512 [Vespula vulgaris]